MTRKSKYLYIFLALLLVLSTPLSIFAERHAVRVIQLPIIVNDHFVMSDVHPFQEHDRTYVPIRFITEELGCKVT